MIITKAKLGQNWRGHTSKQTRQFSTSDFNERNFGVNPKIRPFAMNFLIGGILPKRFPFSFFFLGLKCKKQLVGSCPPTRKCRVHTKQAAQKIGRLEDPYLSSSAHICMDRGTGEIHNRSWYENIGYLNSLFYPLIFFAKP